MALLLPLVLAVALLAVKVASKLAGLLTAPVDAVAAPTRLVADTKDLWQLMDAVEINVH